MFAVHDFYGNIWHKLMWWAGGTGYRKKGGNNVHDSDGP